MTIFPTLPNAVLTDYWVLSISEREHKRTSYVRKKGKYFSKMAENEELLSDPINLPLVLSLM